MDIVYVYCHGVVVSNTFLAVFRGPRPWSFVTCKLVFVKSLVRGKLKIQSYESMHQMHFR